MASQIKAINAYRPRIVLGKRVETDQLVDFIARSTGLNESGVRQVLLELRDAGVGFAFVTLHISMDTFRPVTAEFVQDHVMHTEWCTMSLETAEQINQVRLRGGRIVAVGTTATRVLESAAAKCAPDGSACAWQTVTPFEGSTDLFLHPGHRFRAVDVLLTNFHLPRSTLLMLVSAFAGKDLIDRAYREAIEQEYRFYSFGDAMLII